MLIRDPETHDIEIRLLLEGVYLKYRADFRHYTMASIRRRVSLAMSRFECQTVSELQNKIISDPVAYDVLLQFLTVPTSEMFRDPTYFRVLRERVLPILATYPSIKVWIAGCSTGEELYSIAILLKEEGLLDRTIIYATDINPASLLKAEAGVFAIDQFKQYTLNYQKAGGKAAFSDYYTSSAKSAILSAELRKNVVFADHSLATDNVFAEVQLVSCRNVLIYFDRELQDRALRLFRDSLVHRGFLGLGSKETIRFSSVPKNFEDVEEKDRIYRKIGVD